MHEELDRNLEKLGKALYLGNRHFSFVIQYLGKSTLGFNPRQILLLDLTHSCDPLHLQGWLPSASGLPRINYFSTTELKILHVTSSYVGSMSSADCSYLGIRHRHRTPPRFAISNKSRVLDSGVCIKRQNASGEVLFKHCHGMGFKFLFALACRQACDTVKDFCHCHRTDCKVHRWLRINPSKDTIVRFDPHKL